jgi:hypothetical protein
MGNALMVTPQNKERLEKGELKSILLDIPGIYDFRHISGNPEEFTADYDLGEDTTTVDVYPEGNAVYMRPYGDACLQLALEIQMRIAIPLVAFDSSLGFVIPLKGLRSWEELSDIIDKKWEEASAQNANPSATP